MTDKEINQFTKALGYKDLHATATVKMAAAATLNNQNISSSVYIFISDTLELTGKLISQGKYPESIKEIKGLVNLAYLEAKQPTTPIQERILLDALKITLESLILVLSALENIK